MHTTIEGAKRYVNLINGCLEDLKPDYPAKVMKSRKTKAFLEFNSGLYRIPQVRSVVCDINSSCSLESEFDFAGGLLEVFLEAEVGPHLCSLVVTLYEENQVLETRERNIADQWCYYKRTSVVTAFRQRVHGSRYKLCIEKGESNPFSDVITKKHISADIAVSERYIKINRLAINAIDISIN